MVPARKWILVYTSVQALNGSDLVIVEVTEDVAGVYRCWVANVVTQVTQDISVLVIG